MKRTELFVLLLILAIAAGFRLYQLDTIPHGMLPDEMGNRMISAFAGIFTVLGTYLLAKRMFGNWEMGAIAGFLLAVSSWHVLFSRLALGVILAPLCAVWGFYYLWTALRSNRLWHWIMAGAWFGLGFYTHPSFDLLPGAMLCIAASYFWALRADFHHDKYRFIRHQLLAGIALMVVVMLAIILPIAGSLYAHPENLVGPTSGPVATNFLKTLGMFAFMGDTDWSHGIAGQPVLFWLVAAFFVAGFIRSFLKIGRSLRTHGHPPLTQVLLLSWLFFGLIPAALPGEGIPNALRSLIVSPAVAIIAGEGIWWLYIWMRHWYSQRDMHHVCVPGPHGHEYCTGEGTLVVTIALVAVLITIGVAEWSRYFHDWARDPHVKAAFSQQIKK